MLASAFWVAATAAATAQTAEQKRKEEEARRGAAQQQTQLPVPAANHFVLDQISVIAARNARQLLDIPATVTVIDRKEIEKNMVRDIDDLVRYEPGIKVDRQTSGTDPFGNLGGFTIRGVGGNRVLMMIDGTRVIERITDGNRDFVDMSNLKAVEIVRGPGSVLWGSDALGGIVAFTTKDPDDYLKGTGKHVAGQVDTSFDTFDNSWIKSVTSAFQSDQRGTWQALINYSHRSAEEGTLSKADPNGGIYGCPRNPQAIRCNELNPLDLISQNLLAKLIFRPNDEHEFKVTGEIFNKHSYVNQKSDLGIVPPSATTYNLSYLRQQEQTRERFTLAHDWKSNWGFLDSVRWQFSSSPQARIFTGDRLRQIAGGQLQRLDFLLDYRENFYEFDSQFNSSFALGPTFHRLTYGAYWSTTDTDYKRRDITTNLTTGAVTVTNAGGFNFANATTTRIDGFVQDEIELFEGRLKVTPGLRYATYNIDPRPDPNYAPVPGKEVRQLASEQLVKQVGAVFKIDETYSIFGRYAEGFKMPTAQQLYTSLPLFDGVNNILPNPELRPESVKSYEAGLRGRFSKGYFSVSAFYADYDDFIQSLFELSSGDITNINLSKVQIRGMEAFGEVELHPQLFANLSVSYQVGKQIAEPGAEETPFNGASPLTVVTGLRYVDPALGLQGELIGTFANGVESTTPGNHFQPEGYAVFDTIWSWKPFDKWTLRAAVYNIADTRYFKWPNALWLSGSAGRGRGSRQSARIADAAGPNVQGRPERRVLMQRSLRGRLPYCVRPPFLFPE